jgi:hypothetical protein
VNVLHETIDDIAGEVTPASPLVGPAMLRGRRMRKRRLGGHRRKHGRSSHRGRRGGKHPGANQPGQPDGPGRRAGVGGAAPVPADTPLVRPVLLKSDPGSLESGRAPCRQLARAY